MEERPILFNSEMIKAILDGRKTMTRRAIKPQPLWVGDPCTPFKTKDADPKGVIECPYGIPGDQLWVRETWCVHSNYDSIKPLDLPDRQYLQNGVTYMADVYNGEKSKWMGKTRPSIFMCRWMSRIQIEITDIKIERVQDITKRDAKREGIVQFTKDGVGFKYGLDSWDWSFKTGFPYMGTTPKIAFEILWDSINAKRGFGWDMNPFVWVVEFERI